MADILTSEMVAALAEGIPHWRNIATITFEDTPIDGTIIDLVTLPVGTWLEDVYLEITVGWQTAGNGARFSACGWDLAGEHGGAFYLHAQMSFNAGSWSPLDLQNDNQFISGTSSIPHSLARAGLFLGSNISSSPNIAAPPISEQSYLPGRVLDDSLPLQILFADDGEVTYSTGSADIWLKY